MRRVRLAGKRLDALATRVEESLKRADKLGPQLPEGAATALPWAHDAVGYLEKNASGIMAVTRVVLRPRIVWAAGTTVPESELMTLHHQAHEGCFIANSVTTNVSVEPVW